MRFQGISLSLISAHSRVMADEELRKVSSLYLLIAESLCMFGAWDGRYVCEAGKVDH